jgi:hypothetical protein
LAWQYAEQIFAIGTPTIPGSEGSGIVKMLHHSALHRKSSSHRKIPLHRQRVSHEKSALDQLNNVIERTPVTALILLILVLLTPACTMDLGLTKGYLRPPIEDYKTMRVLGRMPKGAEAIATVRASSDSGFARERNLDHAMNELKKKAARLGANAVIITHRNSPSQIGTAQTSGGGLVITNNESETLSGIAVWID